MLDEIQSGMCRTGRWFAHQHHDGLKPDVITLAKALGNGVPIGACLAEASVAELMQPGSHGTTFGGNPLACRAALTVIEIMREEAIAERAERAGQRLLAALRTRLDGLDCIRDIRGRGLMVGIELDRDCPELKHDALEKGVIINVTRGSTVRLLPPLIVSDEEVDRIAEVVAAAIHKRYGP